MAEDRPRLHLAVLLPHLRGRAGAVSLTVLVVVVMVALDLTVPVLLARFVDGALGGVSLEALMRIALFYLAASIATQLLSATATYLGTRIGWAVANDLRVVATRHVLTLDLDHHTTTNPGTLIERVDGDITSVARFFSHFAVKVLAAVLLLVGIVVVSFNEHPVAGWTVLGFMGAVFAVLAGVRGFAVRAADAERGISGVLVGFIEEHLGALDDLRANGGGVTAMHRFRSVMSDYERVGVHSWLRRSVIWVSSIGLFSLASLLALAVGSWLALGGAITIGTVLLLYQYMAKLESPIEEITNQTQELQKAAAGLGRLSALLATEPSVGRSGTAHLPGGPLRVELDDVGFAYETLPVLHGISLDIAAGTRVGLLGRTGSGKTTLIKLLARLADPTTGAIRLAGHDLRALDPSSLADRVATVPQDVQLFGGTVKDNVTFFDPDTDDQRVLAALEEIGLGRWLEGLPDGIHTLVGAEGVGLSAGEAQLLAFARAYLRDPGLVILDEPSSRVDPATEAILADAIDRLTKGRTAVIIAHRLETVSAVDRIVVLADGLVVEDGRRADLAADPSSLFASMVAAAQWGDGTAELLEDTVRP